MFHELVTYITFHLLLAILPQTCVFGVNVTFNYGSIMSGFNHRVCPSNDVIQNVSVVSDLHCSYLCASDVTCGSFFYHYGDTKCVTCDDVYYDTSDLETYTGMNYYIPENVMASLRRWNEWTPWSLCSATCHQGTRTRTRTCNDTVYTCTGDSLQIDTCNTFACTPRASTCAEWASRGFNETREMVIDPDGNNTNIGDVTVLCDLNSEPGQALTVLHHNGEQRTRVDGYESCGSYEVILYYNIGFEAATRVADISSNCKQYVKWECYRADLSWPRFSVPCTAWKNRSMAKSGYFTGPYQSGKYCECGDQGACLDPAKDCNCDHQPLYLTLDDGYATDKRDLPMYSFSAGDTGSSDEYGYHTVGPLICW